MDCFNSPENVGKTDAITLYSTKKERLLHNHHHNHFTALFPGPPRWAGARRELLDSMVQGKINRDTSTIRLGTTPSGLSNAHLHHPPFFTGRMPFLPPNQQSQSTEGNKDCYTKLSIIMNAISHVYLHSTVSQVVLPWHPVPSAAGCQPGAQASHDTGVSSLHDLAHDTWHATSDTHWNHQLLLLLLHPFNGFFPGQPG